ncbi:MAG: DEAD/DEAH box helicase [Pseudomonadota bacterium]
MKHARQRQVTAVLGPTNTGKTYLAMERLLAYRSGMIGFPLRLLARENYDRACKIKGPGKVALITGEERITPPGARYFFCTVESMPLQRPVEFLAVDEIQLCGDPERGHIFTERLLHARGTEETMLLGADTIRPVLQTLVPEAEVISRPRFSTLSYTGPRKITRLAPRSAVVAFSAADVYSLAELIRRQRGGTAVVLGALSPRTRNAQVALFDSGEVDYLVATDAIGMGLNLNLDHVAFSQLAKFDGRVPRRLTPAEVGQIAGRAGRHMSDGTFGPTGDLRPMDQELVEAVESHRFDPLVFAYWRNRRLDFRSPRALLRSLDRPSEMPELMRGRPVDDHQALIQLGRDPEVEARAGNPDAVHLLWEVCQVPDFRKVMTEQHTGLLKRLFKYLTHGEGELPEDWVARQIKRLDRIEGEIDALVTRIAHVRTWTYITHRNGWLADPDHWQGRARAIEDRLSDALHEGLTQRFVDRRSAVLLRRLQGSEALLGAIRRDGTVLVEGEFVGRLEGFRFAPDKGVEGEDAKALLTAARRALAGEIPQRVVALEQEADGAFLLEGAGRIAWRGAPVARLVPGATALAPGIVILDSELLDGAQRERLRRRLSTWLATHLRRRLGLLFRACEADPGPAARGILFQLAEALGSLPRARLAGQIQGLSKAERKALIDLGVRLGAVSVFFPALLGTRALALRALLWATYQSRPLPELPARKRVVLRPAADQERAVWAAFCQAIGYRVLDGDLAVRVDALERLANGARRLAKAGPFDPAALLKGCPGLAPEDLPAVAKLLGYQVRANGEGLICVPRGAGRKKAKRPKPKRAKRADSPFAKLRELKLEP